MNTTSIIFCKKDSNMELNLSLPKKLPNSLLGGVNYFNVDKISGTKTKVMRKRPRLFSFGSILLICSVVLFACESAHLSAQDVPNPDNSKVVFSFDDHSIPWKKNLKITMLQGDKHESNPVLKRGGRGSLDDWMVQFYGSVIKVDGKYRLWYIASDSARFQTIRQGTGFSALRPAYAESEDGVNWTKPSLGLVDYNGSKDNNLVKILPDETGAGGAIHLLVLHEPEDPNANEQYKMFLTVAADLGEGEGRGKGSTTIVLFSADGLTWNSKTQLRFNNGFLKTENLMLPPINFEQGGVYKWNDQYYLAGQVFSPTVWQPDGRVVGRVMTVLRSNDLIKWDSLFTYSFVRNGMSGKDTPVHVGEEAHLASAIWKRGDVLLGTYGLWHGAERWEDRSMDLGFMISNDGIRFREPLADHVLIPVGKEGEWDQGGLLQGQGFENIGDKTYIYYGSWDMTKPSYPPRGGVGIVTFRRDGFGYLSPRTTESIAAFETSLIKRGDLKSGKLRLFFNGDVPNHKDGFKIELVDKQGENIPGYSGDKSALIHEGGLFEEVVWKDGNVANLDCDFAIRVTFPKNLDSKLYSLYLYSE